MGHSTWDLYPNMMRIFKQYHLHLHGRTMVQDMAFPSHPGLFSSVCQMINLRATPCNAIARISYRCSVLVFVRFSVYHKPTRNNNKKFELMLTGRAKAYSSYYPQAVTHRSTNRAQRRVTSFQPKRITNYATPLTPVPWRHLVNDIALCLSLIHI